MSSAFCWCFRRNMFSRRRKMTYVIIGSCLLLLLFYTFTERSSVENILTKSHAREAQATFPSNGNKKKLISRFEDPVEDLLGDDDVKFKAQQVDKDDVAYNLDDPFANDVIEEAKVEDWGAGFRVKPGFHNPLKRMGQERQVAKQEGALEMEDDIINQFGEPLQSSLQRDLSPGQAGPQIPLLQVGEGRPPRLLNDQSLGDIPRENGNLPEPRLLPALKKVPEKSEQEDIQDQVVNNRIPSTLTSKLDLDNGTPRGQDAALRFQPHTTQKDVTPQELKEGNVMVEEEKWTEVSKNKTYDAVKLPAFIEYDKPGDPGENGIKFVFQPGELTRDELKMKDDDFKTHYFDEWISRKLAVHRTLPDDRHPLCKARSYGTLPAVSVLIVFYNEAWTTLLRSVHSILDRTPLELLLEIVLFDDFSDMDHLKEPLEYYLKPLEKVRLFRAKERLGLMRARNMVFEVSRGEVVVFLDSHIECFAGWLEPLLAPIHLDSKTITFPVIEFINPKSFSVGMSQTPTGLGGLRLDGLSFYWLYGRNVSGSAADNRPSPTMPGGLYAISRDYFNHLGQNDPGMDYWGGENIEISLKAWMCGGSILLVPCSHVGHVFRTQNPALRGVYLNFKNVIRVAEVWMDQYKHSFYERISYSIHDFGDVSSRVQLRRSLQCRDFGWYLQYVYPELKKEIELSSMYIGLIKNDAENLCIDRQEVKHLSLQACRDYSIYQHWTLYTDGTIHSKDLVIGLRTVQIGGVWTKKLGIFKFKLVGTLIDINWIYDDQRRLVHRTSGLCLQAVGSDREAVLTECSTTSSAQRWKITTREEYRDIFKKYGVRIDWSV